MKPFFLDRLDFDVKVVELPRLADREVEGFLKYRIAGLYPGHPEQTAFDYRIWQRGKSRFAFLFITRRSVLEAGRQQAGGRPLLLPYLLLPPFLKGHAGEEQAFLFLFPRFLEVFVFRPEEPPAAFAAKRSKRLAADLAAARRLAGRETARWVMFCGPEDADGLEGQERSLTAEGEPAARLRIEEALDRLGRGERGLFAAPRRQPLLSAGWRRQLLALAVLLLAFLTLRKLTLREESYYRSLLRRAGLLQSQSEATIALQAEVEALSGVKQALLGKRPLDAYRLLAELQAALGPSARLQSFVLERRTFQLEAVGPNPLSLMDSFRERDYFAEVRLLQTVPQRGSDQEAFKIAGSVRGE